MKRKIVSSLLTVAMMGALVLSACGSKDHNDNAVQKAETVSTKTVANTKKTAKTELKTPDAKWTVDEVKELPEDIISGIDNLKLAQSDSKLDIASLVKYDKDVVKSVTVDDSKVKYNVPGTYEVMYSLEINLKALEEKAPESKTVQKTITTVTKSGGGTVREDGFFTVSATVDITIVTTEEADNLKEKGEEVVTEKETGVQKENDKNYADNKTAGTNTNKTESNKTESNKDSNKGSNTTSKPADSNKNDNKNNSSSNNSSSTTTKPSESGSKPSAHTHNWVAHTETKTVKAAYDEPVYEDQPIYEDKPVFKEVPLYEERPVYGNGYICNTCGTTLNLDGVTDIVSWLRDNGHRGHGFTNTQVQVGTEQVQVGTETIQVGVDQVQVGTQKVQVDTIHHDAVTETVTTYTCSCGATK